MKASSRLLSVSQLMLVIFFACTSQWALSEPIEVKVNSTHFPPYFEEKDKERASMAVDMIEIMNNFQSKYLFTLVSNPPRRRFLSFEQGRYDLSFFDHMHWGWDKYSVQATKVYLRGGEKYVALAKPERGQEYFNNFKGKRLGGFLGYHYGLANFNSDPKVLEKEFNMELSNTHEGNLLKIIEGRIDVAILTDAFLSRFLVLHPEKKDLLLVSDIWDQEYNFSMIVRKHISPSAQEMNSLLANMELAGALSPLWQKYGIPNTAY